MILMAYNLTKLHHFRLEVGVINLILFNKRGMAQRMEEQPQEQKEVTQEIVFPYIYGSLAFSMGKKGDSYTHKWICYVRGVNNEDLSYLIEKVVFTLHSSFTNPIRQISRPPYEIQEVGWGEFQILIRLHFKHPDMPTVQLPHMLKLHHTHPTGSQQSKKPLCSEIYDEIVFTQKDEHIEKILEARTAMGKNDMIAESQPNEELEAAALDQPLKSIVFYSNYYNNIDAQEHKNRLEDAYRFIKGEISSLDEKMRIADLDIQKVYEDLYSKMN